MSGTSYTNSCPKCGGDNLNCYSDYKPYDTVFGQCLDCGLEYHTEESQLTLEEVNEQRKDYDLEPLDTLKQPSATW